MAASFFFYDLETSGINPREARIMQFAGQRTDMKLKPVGEPVNVMIKLAPDVLPDPEAVLLTGITPQATLTDGLTEAEFLKFFYDEVVKPETTFLGYNSIRFDDEFMRFLHWRNFYDAYEWQWHDNCSRWDLLDVVRLTRALRPEGIEWPVTDEGKPTNRLELLTKLNGLDHQHAHDALNDVQATIAVAKLIRDHQPDLFQYAFDCRGKKKVTEVVFAGRPFVYTSGRYPGETLHTTAAVLLTKHPHQDCALVYDLRHDPAQFFGKSPEELADLWRYTTDKTALRLPVKTLKYNRCPAVAPLGVMKDGPTHQRLQLPLQTVTKHLEALQGNKQFAEAVREAVILLDEEQSGRLDERSGAAGVDGQLYDSFISDQDKTVMRAVRAAGPAEISEYAGRFKDQRLKQLLPLYKARNYPQALSAEERAAWDSHISDKLFAGGRSSRLAAYFAQLQDLAGRKPTPEQEYLLAELQLYGESVMPSELPE